MVGGINPNSLFNLKQGSPTGLIMKRRHFGRHLGLWSQPRVGSCCSIRTQPPTPGRVNGCQINMIGLIILTPYSCVNHRHFAAPLPLSQPAGAKPRPLAYHRQTCFGNPIFTVS